MSKEKKQTSLQIKIIGWFGVVFASTYLILGAINIVLSILDRTYSNIDRNSIILLEGLPILILSLGFKNGQRWGWIGLSIILAFVVVWTVFKYEDVYGAIWGVLSLIALISILMPSVRKRYFAS